MKYLIIYIVTASLLIAHGCKKPAYFPGPAFILQYDIGTETYGGFSNYSFNNFSPQLIPGRTRAIIPDPFSDSVLISYGSLLKDKSGRPLVVMEISKYYLRSQLDSAKGWIPKSDADFYDIFKIGRLSIEGPTDKEGVDIIVNSTNASYLFQSSADFVLPVPAHLDSFNHFEITDVLVGGSPSDSLDWSKLYRDNLLFSIEARKVLVKFNFKCKLYNFDSPHDSILLTEGVFQGFFTDR